MQRVIKCLECGKEIKTWRKNQHFCSVNCRVRNWQHRKILDKNQLDLFNGSKEKG
jgi:hypothetical protein